MMTSSSESVAELSKLVQALPAALAKAELTDPADLVLWKVPFADLKEPLTKSQEVVLAKFLRARENNVETALDMLVKTFQWRKSFNMSSLMTETFSDLLNSLGQIYGKDRSGKPVTYNYYGGIAQEDILNNPDTFLRWRIQLMEKAISLLDFEHGLETITQVHDYSGASMFMDPRLKVASKKIIQIFQDHYPEMLERKFFVGVPALAEYLFNIMSSFVSKRTSDKFVLASATRTRAVLLEHIDPSQLPPKYGGFEDIPAGEDGAGAAVDVKKVTVPAWKAHTFEIPVEHGDTVTYEWATVMYDIGCKAEIKSAQDKLPVATQSHGTGEAGKATLMVEKGPGTFVLTLDNSHAYFYEKSVLYRVRVTKASSSGAPAVDDKLTGVD